MRAVVLILLGLAIGAVGAAMAVNALAARNAFPHGVMTLSGYHMHQLREAATATPCDPAKAWPHAVALSVLATDVVPAFLPDGQQDATFARYADQHQATLERIIGQWPSADCPALTAALGEIGDGCKACHRDYK